MLNEKYFDLGIEPRLHVGENNEKDDPKSKAFRKLMQDNLDTKAIFTIEFNSANMQGDLAIYHDGWNIVMKNEESINLGNGVRKYNPQRRYFKLENEYHVIVTEIDDESRTIYVSHSQATRILRYALSAKIREQLKENQKKKTKDRKKIVLPARVSAINDEENFLKLDIAGFNIIGIAKKHNLNYDRIQYKKLSHAYKVGDEIDVQIYKIGTMSNGMHIFHCGNNTLRENAWEGISKRIAKNDMIIVRCERLTGTGAFVGDLEGEDVSVFCIYPKFIRTNREDEIQPGQYYRCVVKELDEAKHNFKCSVVDKVKEKQLDKAVSGLKKSAENALILDFKKSATNDDMEMDHEMVTEAIKEHNDKEETQLKETKQEDTVVPEVEVAAPNEDEISIEIEIEPNEGV